MFHYPLPSSTYGTKIFLAIASLILFSAQPTGTIHAAEPVPPTFFGGDKTLVCLNTFQPFGFGATSKLDSSQYERSPFENGGPDPESMPSRRLEIIRAAGFQCVRMVVDIAPLLASANHHQLDELIKALVIGISRRVSAGLKVIVDIHPLPKGTHPVEGWSDVDLIDGPLGSKFSRLLSTVTELATRLSANFDPKDVSLELFNEPPLPHEFVNRATWNVQILEYWRRIRAALPEHTLIVSGMGLAAIDGTVSGFSPSGLLSLNPADFDANTAFAFHFYEPIIFTHQGTGFFSHVHGLHFPAISHPGGQEQAEVDFARAITQDSQLNGQAKREYIADFILKTRHNYSFFQYWNSWGYSEAIDERFTIVVDWAKRNRLHPHAVVNTEFGVNHNRQGCNGLAPAESASLYISAVRKAAVHAHLGAITVHEAQGSCFAIQDRASPYHFDAGLLAALGLTSNTTE